MSVGEFRKFGRKALEGKWGIAAGNTALFLLVAFSIISILELLGYMPLCNPFILSWELPWIDVSDPDNHIIDINPLVSLLNIFLPKMMELGLAVFLLSLVRVGDASTNQLFHFFKSGKLFARGFSYSFLYTVYSIGWTLLFVIPGFIKMFSYALAPFILVDNPEFSANQAITESRRMMKGHKFRLFLLYLTFTGWFLLCMLTLGIGLLWFIPYVQATTIQFYLRLKELSSDSTYL